MNLKEFQNKFAIYFTSESNRWPDANTSPKSEFETGELGPYQLDTTGRLIDGHFPDFDKNGLPIRIHKVSGKAIHPYSTMCCFAFAHWNLFQQDGNTEHIRHLINVADYIITTAKLRANGAVLLKDAGPDGVEHGGHSDALNLGQALSLLSRAYQATNDKKYLELADGCVKSFQMSTEDGGVSSNYKQQGAVWYDEIVTKPSRHVLNGMICALWGLRDYSISGHSDTARDLYENGVASVASALPSFDTGWWSLYWIAENPRMNYVATMNYHLLHACQLVELWKQTDNLIFKTYADRFSRYASSPICRARALLSNVVSKIRLREVMA